MIFSDQLCPECCHNEFNLVGRYKRGKVEKAAHMQCDRCKSRVSFHFDLIERVEKRVENEHRAHDKRPNPHRGWLC